MVVPFAFDAVYVTVYVPLFAVFTVLTVVTVTAEPSLLVAVAPASVYVAPTFKLTVAFPFKVMIGA